jgi:hypothetical protein
MKTTDASEEIYKCERHTGTVDERGGNLAVSWSYQHCVRNSLPCYHTGHMTGSAKVHSRKSRSLYSRHGGRAAQGHNVSLNVRTQIWELCDNFQGALKGWDSFGEVAKKGLSASSTRERLPRRSWKVRFSPWCRRWQRSRHLAWGRRVWNVSQLQLQAVARTSRVS